MQDIFVFLGFANFYKYFIKHFSIIKALFIFRRKITIRTIVNQDSDEDDKQDNCDNQQEKNLHIKKLSKRKEKPDNIEFLSSNTQINLI